MSDVSQGPGWWQASDGKWYPPQQQPAAVQPMYQPAAGKRSGLPRGCLWALLAVGALVVLGAIGAALGGGDEDGDGSSASDDGPTQFEEVEIVECGTDQLGFLQATLEATNNSSERSDYFIDVVFESPNGQRQYGSSPAIIDNVEPGQTATGEAVLGGEAPAGARFECRVAEVERNASL